MSDKLRDSVRFLYSQPGCDFNTLLKAAMTCENEAVSRASSRAKSMQVDTNENTEVAKTGISSIREQLDQMNAILKGANFKTTTGTRYTAPPEKITEEAVLIVCSQNAFKKDGYPQPTM